MTLNELDDFLNKISREANDSSDLSLEKLIYNIETGFKDEMYNLRTNDSKFKLKINGILKLESKVCQSKDRKFQYIRRQV